MRKNYIPAIFGKDLTFGVSFVTDLGIEYPVMMVLISILNTLNQIAHDGISSPSAHQRTYSLYPLYSTKAIHPLATHGKGFLMCLLSTCPLSLAHVHTLPISGILTCSRSFLGFLLADNSSKAIQTIETLGGIGDLLRRQTISTRGTSLWSDWG